MPLTILGYYMTLGDIKSQTKPLHNIT